MKENSIRIYHNRYPVYIFIFITIITGIFLLYIYQHDKNEQSELQNSLESGMQNSLQSDLQSNCVCVFDLDNTITCGLDNAKKAVDECKKNNCDFAINTARTSPYTRDIKYKILGLPEDTPVYHGTWNTKLSYVNSESLDKEIASNKVTNLNSIKDRFKVPKDKIILFDDNTTNITFAKNYGYSTITANDKSCGLRNDVHQEIEEILMK